jgi:phosphatidylglycerophosphate synthase
LIIGLLLIYGWDHFPTALIGAVVGTEFFLSVGRPIKIRLGKSGKANSFGKMKMWCQSAAMFGLAAGAGWTLYLAGYFLWAALVFACLSVAWHIRDILV